jgi:indolepyruvate ferredoxin oxidoreductase
MTGGQPIDGALSISQLIQQLSGEGVKRIAVVSDQPDQYRGQFSAAAGITLHHRDELDKLQRVLRDYSGCSVLIYQQACAAEKRRKRKKSTVDHRPHRIVINEEICEGCGDCSAQSNCLSVLPKATPLGRKRQIDQHGCNLDYSCVKGFCPSFVSVLNAVPKQRAPQDDATILFEPLPAVQLPDLTRPWNTVVAGVGGTGVLTVTALIAMAAHIEGKGCATLNQTGLAQKFGAVVSHVRIAQQQDDIKAVRVPAGEADLLLGCDLVVSTGYDTMGKTAIGRTQAIINDAALPTAAFIHDPDAELPTAAMRAHIEEQTGSENVRFVNATQIAELLLGDSLYVNLFLLGVAFQRGKVPVSAAALDAAIELNGKSIAGNQKALLMGRRYAVWPERIAAMLPSSASEQLITPTIEALIEDRMQRLTRYQSARLAEHYRQEVGAVRAIDPQAEEASSITRSVAEQLYRLTAIKDEYEVARLYTAPEYRAQLDRQFEPGYRLAFHLAPPLLSRRDNETGRIQKQVYGTWILSLFRLLSRLRSIRNTWLDPFAWTEERRAARRDLDRYRADIALILAQLRADNYGCAGELAQLPSALRGFGPVRERSRADYERNRARLRNTLSHPKDQSDVLLWTEERLPRTT